MPRRTRPDTRDRATEPEFYLPAGTGPSFPSERVERIWAMLFNHRVGPGK
ncbi:hypothetical protein [Halobellus sp. GM3]